MRESDGEVQGGGDGGEGEQGGDWAGQFDPVVVLPRCAVGTILAEVGAVPEGWQDDGAGVGLWSLPYAAGEIVLDTTGKPLIIDRPPTPPPRGPHGVGALVFWPSMPEHGRGHEAEGGDEGAGGHEPALAHEGQGGQGQGCGGDGAPAGGARPVGGDFAPVFGGWAADGTELSRVVRRAPQGCLRPIPLRGSLSTSGVVSAAGGALSRHEGLADAMETIRDVAPAASSGTLAGVVGCGWRVGRAVARGVVGAAGGWVAWAGRAVGMRCSSASPLHENVLWGAGRAQEQRSCRDRGGDDGG